MEEQSQIHAVQKLWERELKRNEIRTVITLSRKHFCENGATLKFTIITEEILMKMKTITLDFKGYWIEENKGDINDGSGIYCVYSCEAHLKEKTCDIEELLYIGEASDVRERIKNHDRLDDWRRSLTHGQTLCYSFAQVEAEDRERAEAALIFEKQPPYNREHTKEFIYADTVIETSGCNCFLPEQFMVVKGERK